MISQARAPICALAALVFASVFCAPTVRAQEGIFTMAATEPSPGVWMFRQQVQYLSLSRDPTPLHREVDEWRSHTMLAYGLTPRMDVSLMVPWVYRDIDSSVPGESSIESGLDDPMLMAHYRIYQNHSGPIDTTRLSLMAGAKIPVGDPEISAGRVEPVGGAIFTLIRGRHGTDVSLMYEYNTGGFKFPVRGGDGQDDAVHYDAAYLYRLFPAQYTAQTSEGAWYALVEMNGLYELNGDNEVLLSPGIMFEGGHFGLELGVQLPVWQDLDHRPKTDFAIVVGLRWLF
jgi:hypothetical protein